MARPGLAAGLQDLPDDVLLIVVGMLDAESLRRASCTCTALGDVVRLGPAWRGAFSHDIAVDPGSLVVSAGDGRWQQAYASYIANYHRTASALMQHARTDRTQDDAPNACLGASVVALDQVSSFLLLPALGNATLVLASMRMDAPSLVSWGAALAPSWVALALAAAATSLHLGVVPAGSRLQHCGALAAAVAQLLRLQARRRLLPPTLSAAALLLAVPVLLGLWLQGVLAGPGTPLLAPLPVGAFLCVRAAQRAPAIVRGAIILLSLLATAVLLPLLLTMDGVLHASPWMLALPALIALVDAGAGAYDACTATSREERAHHALHSLRAALALLTLVLWSVNDMSAVPAPPLPWVVASLPLVVVLAVQQLTALRALRRRAAALAVTYRVMRAMPADDEIGTGCVAQVALDADAGE